MKLEQQVVSRGLAIKLKDYGFEQDSYFSWFITKSRFIRIEQTYHDREQFEKVYGKVVEKYSAYTVAELGEMLPDTVKNKFNLRIGSYPEHYDDEVEPEVKVPRRFSVGYYDCGVNSKWLSFANAETEADARAKMLIYLKENNLL